MMKRLVLLLLLLTLSSSVFAQRFNRQVEQNSLRHKQWEVGLIAGAQSGSDFEGESGSSLDIDSEYGWGFTIGYNLTPKWNVSWRFLLAKPDYSATIVPEDPAEPPQTIDYTMSRYSNMFNATYHFMKGPITPYIQGGLGWTRLDSNIIDRPPTTGCWWDPWWGWVCSTTWTTYETTEFAYNAGLGLRWDVNGALYMRGSYNREWVSVDSGTLEFDLLSLEVGFMW